MGVLMMREEIYLSTWNIGTLGVQKRQTRICAVAGSSTDKIQKGWKLGKGISESFSSAGNEILQWQHTAFSIQ